MLEKNKQDLLVNGLLQKGFRGSKRQMKRGVFIQELKVRGRGEHPTCRSKSGPASDTVLCLKQGNTTALDPFTKDDNVLHGMLINTGQNNSVLDWLSRPVVP